MSRVKAFAVASCLGLLAAAFAPARADQWNKKTELTVNEPVALPTTVLQPGKYVIKLMDSQVNRNIVQVFTEDEQKLITTILAIPNYKLTPVDNTTFSFWETAPGQPRALRTWFYPGDNYGQEFAYPKDMALKIAQANNTNVPAVMTDTESDVAKAEVRTMTPSGETREMAENNQQPAPQSSAAATDQASSQSSSASSSSQSAMNANQPPPETAAQSSAAQSAAENPSHGQNVHAMPENTQAAQSSTDTSASQSADQTSATGAAASNQSSAGVSAGTTSQSAGAPASPGMTAGSMDHNRSELPRTGSPLPLTGLAGLGAAAAAVAARIASRRR